MFDMKKRLGYVEKRYEDLTASGSDAGTNTTNPSTNVSSAVTSSSSGNGNGAKDESWVELAPSRTSLCSSVVDSVVMVEQEAVPKDKDSRLSPVSMQSPHVEFDNLEQVKYKLVKEMLPPGRGTDWIWDWSSRPESIPPKHLRIRQYGSNLTTPPNSPVPDVYPIVEDSAFSMRVVFGFIMSNIVTFVIGAAIG
ncbi:hypothetical protein WR25_24257 [Diploscapter pachys]|uniref:Uncharacterized protein n=1 Tax=Diploscapter pachys TaxID=2018661 RepID=A0A2A2LK95_9BILA|nr:hypothetical protein WR25_24257 [Diploscapter pachys]